MRSMIEFTALATVGILVLWLVRKHVTRVAPAIVAMAGLTMAAALTVPTASAGEVQHGSPNYTLPADQTVHTDLIVFADTTRIEGNVDGDLILWSQDATVTGHVKGDIIAFDIPKRTLNVEISDAEMAARLKDFKPPALRWPSGVFRKYVDRVASASVGATT